MRILRHGFYAFVLSVLKVLGKRDIPMTVQAAADFMTTTRLKPRSSLMRRALMGGALAIWQNFLEKIRCSLPAA